MLRILPNLAESTCGVVEGYEGAPHEADLDHWEERRDGDDAEYRYPLALIRGELEPVRRECFFPGHGRLG